MKQFLLSLLTVTIMPLLATAQTTAPAFPGAEGTARWTTTGGRGGKVIHVTNLNDSGTGSLRAACQASGARIVVFDVSGIIELKSTLKINNGNITILGQTAPGDGICLKNYTFNINTSNVIVRFIRCRMGDEKKTEDDAMNSYTHSNNFSNIIVDHCTLSWCTDECGSFYGITNFSLQWCVLSESLRNSVHDKGAHGYGGIWGGKNAFYHHNLIADHDSRNPRFDHDYVSTLKGPIDMVNNVVYNWGGNSTYGGESANDNNEYKKINMVNNYYKPGKATSNSVKSRLAYFWTSCDNCKKAMGTSTIVPAHVYAAGNYMYGSSSVTADNWNGITLQSGSKSSIKSDSRFVPEGYENQTLMTQHSAEVAFDKVLSYAGASYKKDVIDQRIARETAAGNFTYYGSNGSTGGLIDTQGDVGGWPEYKSATRLTDTDNDGMPDVWETANGLNPNSDADASTMTLDSKGYYTNIEVYANSLVEDLIKKQNADAETAIDEYYPTTAKAAGVVYYDENVTAEGGYPQTDGLEGTVTWELSSDETQQAAYSASIGEYLGGNSLETGSNLTISGYGTYGNVRFCKFQAKNIETEALESNKVVLSFTPKSGNKFLATAISFSACKIGTGNGNFDAKWIDGGSTTLVTNASPSRNRQQESEGSNYFTTYNFDLTGKAKETDGSCSLVLNMYNIRYAESTDNDGNKTYNYKEMGLANVIVKGIIINSETGISTPVAIPLRDNGAVYNLSGQRINANYRGIVIKNGRKMIQ